MHILVFVPSIFNHQSHLMDSG